MFRIIVAVLAALIMIFFVWEIYKGAVAALEEINALLDGIADTIIYASPAPVLIAVVYLISMWAKRHAPVPLALRGPMALLPRQAPARRALPAGSGVLPVSDIKLKEKINARK